MQQDPKEKHDQDNRSNQLNPNNDAFHQSRGEDGRPDDWDDNDDRHSNNDREDDYITEETYDNDWEWSDLGD